MINTRRLFSNAAVSVAQTIISGLVLFILYRYLIDQLGSKQLGLWSVILASTSVARLSDMGLTGSVVKFVARYRALNDDEQAAHIVQTAALSIAGVMAILCLAVYPLLDKVLALSIPEESMAEAMLILPYAVFSLWLGSVGGVFQSGLDGCQRMDIRNILMIISNLFLLASAYYLVPLFGLKGLAIGQVFQGSLLMLASWFALHQQLKALPWLPYQWRRVKFKEMLGYSVNFQINSIAMLLFDPTIKLLMSRYGGLSTTAYYEMANQLVIKLRALLIAATQALTPTVAELHETAPEKIPELYLKAYRIVFFVTIPFYAAILIALPLISDLWLGHIESQFILFGTMLLVGWGLNTLCGPAYFVNLGTGELKWNSISHVLMAVLNVVLGLMLGPKWGALGVVSAAMISLVIASGLLILMLHKHNKIPFRNLVPREHYIMLIVLLLYTSLSLLLNYSFYTNQTIFQLNVEKIILYIFILGVLVWWHPYKKIMFVRIKNRLC